ncbi:ankyrin repeat domain-containing protein [Wolbachia endosymbiont of Pentidionis agamae]|uniref:ankyrin repeat domain-containing protein n=1 Tax=Wolbachia endosymbiont of Pentidionis agamae TaxID=3110435 RepID=UPI002FD0230D
MKKINKRLFKAIKTICNINLIEIEKLIKNGADVNAKDEYEMTALHLAAQNGHIEVADLLLKNEADVDGTNKDGETPLSITKDLKIRRLFMKKCITKLEISNPDIVSNEEFKKSEKIIKNDHYLNSYYAQCIEELKRLKKTKIENTEVTVYDILEEKNLDKLVSYAENKILEKSYHASDIRKQWKKAKELQKLKDTKFVCQYKYKDKKTGENTGEYRETEISLYKILVEKDLDKLAGFFKHPKIRNDIKKCVESLELSKDFPIYGDRIEMQCRKGLARRYALNVQEKQNHNAKVIEYSSLSLAVHSIATCVVCAAIGFELLPTIGVTLNVGIPAALITACVTYYANPDNTFGDSYIELVGEHSTTIA